MGKICSFVRVLKILTLFQILNVAVLPQEDFLVSTESSTNMTSSSFSGPTSSILPLPISQPFISYTDASLFLFIESIRIDYRDHVIRTSDLAVLQVNNSLRLEYNQLIFSSVYSTKDGEKEFRLSFLFTKDTKKGKWQVRMFQHENVSPPEEGILYQYENIYKSIVAQIGVAFNCSGMTLYGTARGNGTRTYNSRVEFTGIFILPFLTPGEISKDYVSCRRPSIDDKGNQPDIIAKIGIGLIVFVLVASTVGTSAFLVKKYQRRGHYDILSN